MRQYVGSPAIYPRWRRRDGGVLGGLPGPPGPLCVRMEVGGWLFRTVSEESKTARQILIPPPWSGQSGKAPDG